MLRMKAMEWGSFIQKWIPRSGLAQNMIVMLCSEGAACVSSWVMVEPYIGQFFFHFR